MALIDALTGTYNSSDIPTKEKESINSLLSILESITWKNAKERKGILTRITIDSLVVGSRLGEKIIQFDQSL